VWLLLARGADPNLVQPQSGTSPLFVAAQAGHLDVVAALLAHGADPNLARTSDGATPILMASTAGYPSVIVALLAHGADPNSATSGGDGTSIVWAAAANGHVEAVKVLLAHGADPNLVRTDNGISPINIAAYHGHLQVVSALVAGGADPDLAGIGDWIPHTVLERTGMAKIDAVLCEAYRAKPRSETTRRSASGRVVGWASLSPTSICGFPVRMVAHATRALANFRGVHPCSLTVLDLVESFRGVEGWAAAPAVGSGYTEYYRS
jgi:hypothetical protein